MCNPRQFIQIIAPIVLFVALELCCTLLILDNGAVQRTAAISSLREVRSFFLDKTGSIGRYFNLREENTSLLEENVRLKTELERYRKEYSPEDSLSADGLFRYIGASVIRNTINSQHNYLILNKGEQDGIHEGMGVVTPGGIVGVVDAVSGGCCRAISFLNTSMAVSVTFEDSKAFGPMSWSGGASDKATVNEVPMHIEIVKGERVLTSGYSSLFPPDIPVGTAIDVRSFDGLSQTVEVRLFQDFSSLKSVYIVDSARYEEITRLSEYGK